MRRIAAAFALSFAVLGATSWAVAQDDVDLEEFEDFSPDIQEVAPQEDQQEPQFEESAPPRPVQSDDQEVEFEEFRPQLEEIEMPEGEAPQQRRQPKATPVVPRTSPSPTPSEPSSPEPSAPSGSAPPPPMPDVQLKAPPPEPPKPRQSPVAEMPKPAPAAKSAVQVQTQTQLPSRNLALDGDFQTQIRNLNQQIALLKEKVIEAKSRLLSYSQKVAQGFASGTQLFMKVNNKLGDDFYIEKLVFYLDGHQIFTREFEPTEEIDEVLAYKGSVLPGRHRIDVDAILNGDTGLFDMGYSARLRLESGEYFAANEGKIVELNLVLFDKGGGFTSVEDRPALKFEIVERDVF